MKTKVWFLYHSGFALQTDRHFLIFDYWRDSPKGAGIDKGVVDPEWLKDKDVIVFASHNHGDHINPSIFRWPNVIERIRLILSDDIPAVSGAYMVSAGQKLELEDLTVNTLASNDEGVAFDVKVDGLRIFHAGDLNWWHWAGEPDSYNRGMAESYKSQIDALGREAIDVAFIPVDPRLGKQYYWAIEYLMKTANVRHVIPMHFFDQSGVVSRLLVDPVAVDYKERIIPMVKRGQMVEVESCK